MPCIRPLHSMLSKAFQSRSGHFALLLAILVLTGCDELEPDCDVHPTVEASDTTVAAFDSVRINAKSRDACGHPLRFLWSFDGGETYDTTTTSFLSRVFTRANLGQNKLRIRALTDQGTVSASTNITITVEERRFAYHLPRDTIFYFADTVVAINLTPTTPIPGIEWYFLSRTSYPYRTDSSRTPVLLVNMPRSLNNVEPMIAQVRLASGARSETTSVLLHGRPRLLGTVDDYSYQAALLGETSLRCILPFRSTVAPMNPHNGQRVINPRFMELDFDGKILQDRLYQSPREIMVGNLSIHGGGTALILGRDDIVPNKDDLYVAAVDRAGGVIWEKVIDVDTSYIQPIRAFTGAGGSFQVLVASYASVGAGDGKPPKVYAGAIHFMELAADGRVVSDKRVVVPNLYDLSLHADRMKDGSVVLAGMRHNTAGSDRSDLFVLNFDFAGQLLWSKVLKSEAGTSRPGSLAVLEDGSIHLTGTDYGSGVSHWSLRLDEKGNQKDYRVTVFPKGYSPSGMARNAQGVMLQMLNGEEGGLILASDLSGNEMWRHTVAKGYRSAYLESALALPDGSFMGFGRLYPGNMASFQSEAFAFRITAEGKFLW